MHKMNDANVPNLLIIKTNKYGGNWDELKTNNFILLDMIKKIIYDGVDKGVCPL